MTVAATLRRIPAEKGWTAFGLALQCPRRKLRGSATMGEAAKLRRRSKHGDGSAFTVMANSGRVWRNGAGGRGSSHPCEAEGGDGADRRRPRRRRTAAGEATGGGERGSSRGGG
uniref:Expressed protein n=1 Tax=Oryza sativa subsp. japonica TaxID=39947 RepID=Q33BC7_ORYSJ|nr:expressed protein [Oryza sativa Japonica Group]